MHLSLSRKISTIMIYFKIFFSLECIQYVLKKIKGKLQQVFKSPSNKTPNAFQKYEYGHLGGWYIKSTLLYKFLKLKQNFRKNKVATGKTPFFVIDPFCTPQSICLIIGF